MQHFGWLISSLQHLSFRTLDHRQYRGGCNNIKTLHRFRFVIHSFSPLLTISLSFGCFSMVHAIKLNCYSHSFWSPFQHHWKHRTHTHTWFPFQSLRCKNIKTQIRSWSLSCVWWWWWWWTRMDRMKRSIGTIDVVVSFEYGRQARIGNKRKAKLNGMSNEHIQLMISSH